MKKLYVVFAINNSLGISPDKSFKCKLRARAYENKLLAKGFTTLLWESIPNK